MPTTRTPKGSQRKLKYDASDDDDVVVVDEEQTKQHAALVASTRKRSAQPPATTSATTTKRQKGIDSFLSPKKHGKKAPVVTPATTAIAPAVKEYVPKHIHKCVEYSRRGKKDLSTEQQKIVAWIQDHYEIPADLEQSTVYGPLSGSSYEERMIGAYGLKQLKRSDNDGDDTNPTIICTSCAELGHSRDGCPKLL